ncbi:hypothetical protein chiPu_0027692, partial [Chiloscyllium punctatum]|nr:hypothetical protein [Chiloscyllium punctatum]
SQSVPHIPRELTARRLGSPQAQTRSFALPLGSYGHSNSRLDQHGESSSLLPYSLSAYSSDSAPGPFPEQSTPGLVLANPYGAGCYGYSPR